MNFNKQFKKNVKENSQEYSNATFLLEKNILYKDHSKLVKFTQIVNTFVLYFQSQTDAVLGWVDKSNGRAFVMDTFIRGYNAPLLDSSQDVYNISGRIENGVTTLKFSRKRETKDNMDLSFADDHCLYMMFPLKGGAFNPINKKIRKHDEIPIVFPERICIKSCGTEGKY